MSNPNPPQPPMRRAQYVAMYETGERGGNYFRFVYLDFPEGFIQPLVLELGVPLDGVHKFVWADDQHAIALAFNTSQQNVSRWMKNRPPELAAKRGAS